MRCDLSGMENQIFSNLEAPEFSWEDMRDAAYRLTDRDLRGMPPHQLDISALRIQMGNLFGEKLGYSYARLESLCDIKQDTFQKVLKQRNGRNVTPALLSKFAVGAGLSFEEAAELFRLMDRPLNPKENRYDYILKCELDNKSNILEFDEDLRSHGYDGILSKPDNSSDR